MKAAGILDTKGATAAAASPTPDLGPFAWTCAGYEDPDIFTPVDQAALARALAVCSDCASRDICLELGISRDEWGVWGGVLLEDGKPRERVRRNGRPPRVPAA